jgi:monovalent cation:H+ antiporter, CPA1 family
MNINEIISITLVLAAVFAYINHRWIKWPPTIGIMVLSLLSSIIIAALGQSFGLLSGKAIALVSAIDFRDVLMNFMLSFLLFAGAIYLDVSKLQKERWPVLILSTAGTLISTILVGGMVWYVLRWFSHDIDFIYCLLFGALISPTDPIAVLAILRGAGISKSLEIKISGESLFNDGVAVVVFMTLAEAARNGVADITMLSVTKLFVQEAVGGVLFGTGLGLLGYYALRGIDDYKVEVLVTIALVMGGYLLAGYLHVSGPLAMVVAGLITGSKVKDEAMSDVSRDYLDKFWELVDEILNAILFLLMGFEMLVIKMNPVMMLIGLIAIFIVLFARWVSVLIPIWLMKYRIRFEKHAVAVLTWGGLRGGLSVALALSLGANQHRDEFVLITYIIVVFSILVQGLTIGKVAKRLQKV